MACEVKKVIGNKGLQPLHKKQKLMRLFSDWVALKRITGDLGQAAAPLLIPQLFWNVCSISLTIYYFTEDIRINTPMRFGFQIKSLLVNP
jgi:hypothetical protein